MAIVHGAEFGTRETYRLLASHFARRGVATLIYDKRGTGESAGSFATATFDDLTADALAAVSLLRADADIDPARVGLAGMSQGGWIIAQAANQSDDVAFLVALSASGFTPAEQAAWLTGSMLAVRGFEQRAIDASARVWGMMYSSLDLIEAGLIEPMPSVPGFWFHALDPHLETGALWERVRQPVLGLWGEMDCQVPAHDSLAAVKAALERGPNRAYRLQILPGADHGMALAGACEREIGAHHGGRYQYASGYLDGPAEWIKSLEPESRGREVIVPAERADSLLGWHQSPDTTVPWFGSLAPQLAMPIALLVLFAAMAITASIGRALSIARGRAQPGASPTLLWGGAGLVGSLATLVGLVALVELLMLADLMSAPIIDGVAVDGISTVFAAAGFLAVATVIAVAAALISDARHGSLRAVRPAAGITAVVGLVVWAGYWGFLPVPSFG
ncbi:MAG TPA: alpha/beta hydrolase [Candidatus Limnocylindrales bacterium]|nr:alpha/beta hydrolase [Candidatus Limnocylindrales bacterium]